MNSVIVDINPGDTLWKDLGQQFIIKYSDSVYRGSKTLVRGADYHVNYDRGLIKFKHEINDTVKVKFLYPEIPPKKQYYRWLPDSGGFTDRGIKPEENKASGENIFIFGNKGVFVDVRTGRTDISQSLWMNIGGRVGNFNISGVLSDENIPRGMETQSIEEVDEIYIQGSSERASFRVGDIEFKDENIEREMLGIDAEYADFRVTAGLSSGKYGRYFFRCEEGKQGPYLIQPEGLPGDISIIRGSEKVWLDGNRLKKGDNEDYIMDYSRASITFSPGISLDSDSRVLILFQYGQYGASSSYYGGSYKREDLQISIKREEEYSENDFESVYSDSGYGWVNSAVFVGSGEGDYEKEDSIFVYRGDEEGAYDVYFNWVGEGKGEYRYVDSLHYFIWTGSGPYSVKRKVKLPGTDNKLSVNLSRGFGELDMHGNLKVRRYSNNFDGNFRDGLSGNFNAEFNPSRYLNTNFKYYRKTSEFVDIEWDLSRGLPGEWEIEDVPEELIEYSVSTEPLKGFKSSFLYGEADTVKKYSTSLQLLPVSFKWENIDGLRETIRGGIHYWNSEAYASKVMRKDSYREEIGLDTDYGFFLGALEGLSGEDTARIFKAGLEYGIPEIKVRGSYINRKNLKNGSIQNYLNGEIDTYINISFLRMTGDFQVSQKRIDRWNRFYEKVSEGEGNYSFDDSSQTYFKDPYGNYIQRLVRTGDFIDTREYSSSLTLETEKIFDFKGFLDYVYRPGLFYKNRASVELKYPEKGNKKVFFKGNLDFIRDDEGRFESDRDNRSLILGYEETGDNLQEYAFFYEENIYEKMYGAYISLGERGGLEFRGEARRINGDNDLYKPSLKMVFNFSGRSGRGYFMSDAGYNYYPSGNSSLSLRMKRLYPEGPYFESSVSMEYDITESFHFVLNGNMNKFEGEDIYYQGRVGLTADFSPE